MSKVPIEFACRWLGADYHTGKPSWFRDHTTLWLDLPSVGGETVERLPPVFFTVNAANTWQLRIMWAGQQISFSLADPYGTRPIRMVPFTQSRLWSQARFAGESYEGWWLRWRFPQADHDIMSVVSNTCLAIESVPSEAVNLIQQLRREIVMNALGAPMPHRSHHGT